MTSAIESKSILSPIVKLIPLHKIDLSYDGVKLYQQPGKALQDRLVVVFDSPRYNTTTPMTLRALRTHWELFYQGATVPDPRLSDKENTQLQQNRTHILQAMKDAGFFSAHFGDDAIKVLPARPNNLPKCQGNGAGASFVTNSL